jgi:hypothetical protein
LTNIDNGGDIQQFQVPKEIQVRYRPQLSDILDRESYRRFVRAILTGSRCGSVVEFPLACSDAKVTQFQAELIKKAQGSLQSAVTVLLPILNYRGISRGN